MANDHALSAKARSLFSQRLEVDSLSQMAELGDLDSVASYLKNEERYNEVLVDLPQLTIHRRDALESRIRMIAYKEFLALMRYVRIGKANFYHYYTKRREIEIILYVMHSIVSGVPYEIKGYYIDLNKLLDIDVDYIIKLKTFDELKEYLNTMEFKGVFDHLDSDNLNINDAEAALNRYYREYIEKLISKQKNVDELQRLFDINDELAMVEHIYRLKKYYHQSIDAMVHHLNYKPVYIDKKRMMRWIKETDAEGFLEKFKNSGYQRYVKDLTFDHIEQALNTIRYRIMLKNLRYSTNSNVILISYMELLKFEIDNVIDVIEGVRYNMKKEDIMDLLIK